MLSIFKEKKYCYLLKIKRVYFILIILFKKTKQNTTLRMNIN